MVTCQIAVREITGENPTVCSLCVCHENHCVYSTGWSHEVSHRHFAALYECCCMCCQRHKKVDHGLTRILHEDLHLLDVADRVTYKLGVIMYRCQHGKAPWYLVDCCTPATDVVGRRGLWSATQQMMVVPRHRLSTVGRRAFTVHGSVVWNSLSDNLHP